VGREEGGLMPRCCRSRVNYSNEVTIFQRSSSKQAEDSASMAVSL
jgi:hypothetical protein